MTNQIIIIISLFYIYYHVSGLSTTNILRLTDGNSLPVLSSKCHCDNCGYNIPPFLQLPIISFLICGGKCKNCKTKIPLFPLILESTVFSGMCILSSILKFSYFGIGISYVFYEIVRIITICLKGIRKFGFIKQYIIAVASMLPFCLFSLFVAFLYHNI